MRTSPLPSGVFEITVKINGKELIPTMGAYDDTKGIKIVFRYEGEEINISQETEFMISITTLHDRDVKFYTAYLYDPTLNPEIILDYNDEVQGIFAVTNFTTGKGKNIIPEHHSKGRHISVEAKNEWVFPTSGVVFIWK